MNQEGEAWKECWFCCNNHSEMSGYCKKCLKASIEEMEERAKKNPENTGWALLQRLCRNCGKQLSLYNSGDECYVHFHANDYRPAEVNPLPDG